MKFYSLEPYDPEPIKWFMKKGVECFILSGSLIIQYRKFSITNTQHEAAPPYLWKGNGSAYCRYFDNKKGLIFSPLTEPNNS